jgi:aminopeptidase N
MAHELAHHWFGDLATCRTASEMWLNEGWASYTERLFDEWLINRETYDANVRSNHKEMLQFAHVRDGGYWPLNNVPHAYTYSNHTYELPSDKIHTLRTYMGDSLFYSGLQHFLNTHLYTHVTSEDLENALEQSTGLDLTDYFNDWIETPGWAGFEVDSFRYEAGEVGMVEVFYSQKSAGNSHTFLNVPFEVSLMFSDLSSSESIHLLSGPSGSFTIESNTAPQFVFLNRNEGISQAVTADEKMIKLNGNIALSNALTEIFVESVTDSAFVRAEHYWVAPDPFKQPYAMYRLSPNRYWKFDVHPEGNMKARLKIMFNGRTNTTDAGWLDQDLITDESKLVLLHRKSNADDWQPLNATITTYGNVSDKFGKIELDSLMAGEYTLAEQDSSLGLPPFDSNANEESLLLNPNPASDFINVDWGANQVKSLELISVDGRSLGFVYTDFNNPSVRLPLSHLGAGIYVVKAKMQSGKTISARLIKN